ncbi:MAG: HEPN domain-containing protein [Ginsengibacter sp.]|jgi:HEPN domain-containing protein
MNESNDYHLWIEFAKNDLLVAKELDIEKHFVHRAVLVHSQQGIEKYLKAFLLFKHEIIIRTHDLLILNKKCEKYDQAFLQFELDLAWISVHYLQSRYPDNLEDISLDEAQKALQIAIKFEKFVLPKFGLKK